MDKNYLNIIKQENPWFWDVDKEYNLVVTDDLDSILSALLLMQYRLKWKIGYYYNFQEGLYEKTLDKNINVNTDRIGVDLSSTGGKGSVCSKSISNHVTALHSEDSINKQDINLNYVDKFICLRNYHSKYNLNTLCLIYSLLGLQPKSDEECALLLLPDSAFQAHYANPNYKDSYVQEKILEKMDLMELYNYMNKYDKNKFYEAQESLRIKTKFYVDDFGLQSTEDVNLKYMCDVLDINKGLLQELQGLFFLQERHKSYTDLTCKNYDKSKFATFVVTSKNYCKFSKVEELK